MKSILHPLIGFTLLLLGCSGISADADQSNARIFRGKLMIYTVDNFTAGVSKTGYQLYLEGGKKSLFLRFPDHTDKPAVKSGMRVEVKGRQQNNHIDVESIHPLKSPSE